jgi:DNA-binding XRE family transcriptional regulator
LSRKVTAETRERVRDWLIALREERGATQGAVAAAAGIAQPSYFEIEKGLSTPKPGTAMKIGEYLGFPWTRFYDDEHDEHEDEPESEEKS